MDKRSPQPFRPYLQVLTERTHPEPIFVAAWTGTNHWLRVELPADVLVRSPRQREREIGRIVRAHYAERKGSAVPFGRITGYVFRSLPDKATRYNVEGVAEGESTGCPREGAASLQLR